MNNKTIFHESIRTYDESSKISANGNTLLEIEIEESDFGEGHWNELILTVSSRLDSDFNSKIKLHGVTKEGLELIITMLEKAKRSLI